MTDTIPISQTRTVPQLTLASFPLALSDLLVLNLPIAHDGATIGDFKLTLELFRNWLLDNVVLTGSTEAPEPNIESPAGAIVTMGWLNQMLDNIDLLLDDKLDASAYNQHYRGMYPSLGLLSATIEVGNSGDYATVDAGNEESARMAIWDDNDGLWVDVGSVSLSTTDALPEGNVNFYVTQEHVLDTFTRQWATVSEDIILQTDEAFSGTITMSGQYRALQISTDGPLRVRLYTSAVKRDDDLLRPIGAAVPEGSGLMLEFVSTPGLLAADLTPVVDGFAATADIPYSMVGTTLDGSSGSFSINFVKTGV